MTSSNDNDSFNADELVAPVWLSAQFFEQVLSQYENAPELKVLNIEISPASARGDHYASVMFRGNISYNTKSGSHRKSLIIKTMPEEEGHKKHMLSESNLFKTEIGMYTKVLPRFEQILKAAGDETQLSATCVYHSVEPRQVIIFEDLVPLGYAVVRGRDATTDEVKGAFSKLAKLHGISMLMQREEPDFLKDFVYGICNMPTILTDPFFTSGPGNFLEMLEHKPELAKYIPQYKSKIHNFVEDFVNVLEEHRQDPQANGYYVLSHGDFHLRNMMFRYNKVDNSFEDCMLLDYQICNISPITIDLIYATYLLMSPEHRRHNFDELIHFYFSNLVQTLQKIGFTGELPTFEELQRQLKRHSFYDIYLMSCFLPLWYGLRTNAVDVAAAIQDNEVRKNLFYSEDFVQEVKLLLDKFEKLGYFE